MRWAVALALTVLPAAVWAQAPETDDARPVDERIRDLEERQRQTDQLILSRQPSFTWSGYADVGFFAPQGNGAGVVQDLGGVGMRHFPQRMGRYGWVFLGDLLAPAVNSRGEPADVGDLPGEIGADRNDPIDSNGAPGFIVNEVNLTLRSALAPTALLTASVDFVPRSGYNFRLGDAIDVDLVQLEWLLGSSRRTSLFFGKIEPVVGLEYRHRKAVQRFGVTPSLIARYTTGTPLGVKLRSKLGPDDLVVLAIAVTNGSSGTELFQFHDEVDSNAGKTVSGRLSIAPPLPFRFELGVSGEWGPQDRALDSNGVLWFWGVDAQLRAGDFALEAQWLRGSGDGETADRVYPDPHRPFGLRLHGGGYVELDWLPWAHLGFLARGEYRDADVWLGDPLAPSGAERLYITRSWRATVGARVVVNDRITVKAEYLRNGEYGGMPEIADDVFTSSAVLSF